jgi:hypothetical protein
MAAALSREMLHERRAVGVFMFRTGLVVLPVWALASTYLYAATGQVSSLLFGGVLMLLIPLFALVVGFSFFASAASQLRSIYEERSIGLLRRQPKARAAQDSGETGSDMESILRRYEQDFGSL